MVHPMAKSVHMRFVHLTTQGRLNCTLARAKVSPKPWEWVKTQEIGCCYPVGENLAVQILPD
jgi:hypothetical protein